ncbi:MAG: hypothetical protein JW982_04160 [Spirochaetes bacterium]|nr:hypothetical protein [Spirochaetota bacterium]
MKKPSKKEILKKIRTGVRLNVKPPKKETPKNIYCRKSKYKGQDTFIFARYSYFYPAA